ncbi:MAG: ATP-binding cassette domain-containing protein [Bacteroidetes bacterium]|nr:ATP-binding cassette domain-containing protein [Bacteroidota bacterium]MBS1932219.1 ATP-binding cassette domain-containing protein [Bacteroidota bacterium]
MLRAENIFFKVGNKVLLHETSVAFEKNRFHVIMGPNGAGKSTILKILAGGEKPSGGSVFFLGKEISQFSQTELARLRAVLSQHYNITFPISTNDMVMMGRYPYFKTVPSKTDKEICRMAIAVMEAENLLDRDYNTLSGGETQKIQMSRILAQIWETEKNDNKFLFLDEPVSHLDLKYQHQLLQVAKDMCKKNITVIAILHDINLSMSYADRILLMKRGEIKYEIKNQHEITTDIIKDVFDMDSKIFDPGNGHKPVVVF